MQNNCDGIMGKSIGLSILRDILSAYAKSNQSADDVGDLQQRDTSALNSVSWIGTFARNNAGTVLGSKK